MTTVAWRPLLDGDLARHARELVAAITDDLVRRPIVDPSLGSGQAGVALLHGYRARVARTRGDDIHAEASAELATDALAASLPAIVRSARIGLFDGCAGTAFALHQLADVVGEAEDTLAELDAVIDARLPEASPAGRGLETGLVGVGAYAASRGDLSRLARVVTQLRSSTHVDRDLVALLAVAGERERLRDATGRLRTAARGGASTAIALALAARALGDDALLGAAHATARRVADSDVTLIEAHALNRLAQAFVDDELAAMARRGFQRLLGSYTDKIRARWDVGFSRGAAGVGLQLLAATTALEPRWDEALLMALPPGSCVR